MPYALSHRTRCASHPSGVHLVGGIQMWSVKEIRVVSPRDCKLAPPVACRVLVCLISDWSLSRITCGEHHKLNFSLLDCESKPQPHYAIVVGHHRATPELMRYPKRSEFSGMGGVACLSISGNLGKTTDSLETNTCTSREAWS